MPFSMADVVNDPDFAQTFTITRSQGGSFVAGIWVDEIVSVASLGIIYPANPNELEQIPEGDRVKGAIAIHSSAPIYQTHVDAQTGISDKIAWNGQTYRVALVWPWQDFGYYKAIALRMSGE